MDHPTTGLDPSQDAAGPPERARDLGLAIAAAADRIEATRRIPPELAEALLRRHIGRRLDQITEVIKAGYAEIYTGNALAAHVMGAEGMARAGPLPLAEEAGG